MRLAVASLLAALLAVPVLALGQTTTTPAGRATAPNTAPTATTPAPNTSLSTTPTTRRGTRTAATTPAGSADEATAKQKCGADPVVWGNPSSKVYHTTESRYYGKTKKGSYMCQKDADAAGFHASKSSAAKAKKASTSS